LNALANPRPKIDSIVLSNMNAIVTFDTVSNWNYRVLGADNLAGPWSNVWTLAAQVTSGYVSFVEGDASGERFYRLQVSPGPSQQSQFGNGWKLGETVDTVKNESVSVTTPLKRGVYEKVVRFCRNRDIAVIFDREPHSICKES
jgi:hypothetical protein